MILLYYSIYDSEHLFSNGFKYLAIEADYQRRSAEEEKLYVQVRFRSFLLFTFAVWGGYGCGIFLYLHMWYRNLRLVDMREEVSGTEESYIKN